MPPAIRPALPADVPDLLRLIRALAAHEKEPDAVQATEDGLHAAMFGDRAFVHALVAEADGHIVGLALWFPTFSTWTGKAGLYLEDLFVEDGARGLGTGLALFRGLAQEAVARGYARMEWQVLGHNEAAQGFYRSIGAGHCDGWQPWRLDGAALAALAG